jgi:hypothetical protein
MILIAEIPFGTLKLPSTFARNSGMLFDMLMPCRDCPFRKQGGFLLGPGRIREFAQLATESEDAAFACPKTIPIFRRSRRKEESYCAGALAFAEKQGKPNPTMQQMHQIGRYNPKAITDDAKALVWDSVDDWLDSAASH